MTHAPLRFHLVTRPGTAPLRGAELPGPTRARPPQTRDAVAGSPVTTRAEGDRFTVTLAGDVDLDLADELALAALRAVRHCSEHPRARVHLDVREVTAVDATALRFVERLRRDCRTRGADCTTSSARPAVAQVLALARPVVDGEPAAS